MQNRGISDWTRVVRTQGGLDFCPPPSGPRHSTVLADRGLCHGSTSGVGAAQADGEGSGAALLREGLLEPGSWKGRGSSLRPPVLCSVARFSLSSSLLCKARTPKTLPPRSFPRGRSFFPYVFKRGGPLGHHRPGIVSCLWNGWEDGAGRSDPELASGRDRVSSPCHTSRVVG